MTRERIPLCGLIQTAYRRCATRRQSGRMGRHFQALLPNAQAIRDRLKGK